MTVYHPIPDEILNDPKLGLVSPMYGGFAWFDLDTFETWFWNSETGEKYKAEIKEVDS